MRFILVAKIKFVCLPASGFTNPENYYATALHELTHWTGHESRLNRQFGKRFGDDAYAFEELVAELRAAFVVGHVGFVSAMIKIIMPTLKVG